MKNWLNPTPLLNFNAENIQALITERQWRALPPREQMKAIYDFCRDDIRFGFNTDDYLTASAILQDGYGQCNTKSILFMALLRGVGIPCRLHGFTIDKSLQKGIMNGKLYAMMPQEISHTWVEAQIENNWFNFEGLILDMPYLQALQNHYQEFEGRFTGFGIAIDSLLEAPVEWNGDNDTYIQRDGIVQDFGIFDDPDSFFALHAQKMSEDDKTLFAQTLRHQINDNIAVIRQNNVDAVK